MVALGWSLDGVHWGRESTAESRCHSREAPDSNVCAKLLTHAFTSKSWIRISSGLENLVTRLSRSDPRAQIIKVAVTHFQVVWILSRAYSL